jgi:hypothetical protein
VPLRLCKPSDQSLSSKSKTLSRPASARTVWANEENSFSCDDGYPVRPSPFLCLLITSFLLRDHAMLIFVLFDVVLELSSCKNGGCRGRARTGGMPYALNLGLGIEYQAPDPPPTKEVEDHMVVCSIQYLL